MATLITRTHRDPYPPPTVGRVIPGHIFKSGDDYFIRTITCTSDGCVRLRDGALIKFLAGDPVQEVTAHITVSV